MDDRLLSCTADVLSIALTRHFSTWDLITERMRGERGQDTRFSEHFLAVITKGWEKPAQAYWKPSILGKDASSL